MKFLTLFLIFFKIGLFTIGGGYAMIPMIKSEVIGRGWITEEELLDFMAVSESTPGPFAVNMATFIGFCQNGFFGALAATLGVILPSFIIILIISRMLRLFMENKYFTGALKGVRPVVVGLISAVAVDLILRGLGLNPDMKQIVSSKIGLFSLGIMITVFILSRFKKTNNPILLILISGLLGIVFGLCGQI